MGDTPKQEPPSSLLGATACAGSVALDKSSELEEEANLTTHSTMSVSELAYPIL